MCIFNSIFKREEITFIIDIYCTYKNKKSIKQLHWKEAKRCCLLDGKFSMPCHAPQHTCITITKIITLFMHSKFPMVNHQALHLMYVLNLNNKHVVLCLILLLGKKRKKKNLCTYNVKFNLCKCIKTQTLMEFSLSRNCKKINEKWKVDKRLVLS